MFNITESLKQPGIKRVILDTDTYNEIDDQFAVALAMLAPDKIDLACITAAPFHNGNSESFADGMEKSYREIGICTKLVNESHGAKIPPYYRGSTERMPDVDTPVESEAAHKIAETVMAYDGMTYIVPIGAITNVASAILLHPEIKEKIAIIWLGGVARWFAHPEFNLAGDINATNAVFKSGVPMLQFPCMGVVSHLTMDIYELEHFLRGNSPLGDYLCDNVAACKPKNAVSWSRVIWDISTIAGIINPNLYIVSEQPRPYVNPETWAYEYGKYEGTIEHVDYIHRDATISLLMQRLMK
ncbi:MAG: nucleoside hydrolase [Clostridia bacterium]|nr:nucleoside hydrolase [Clostridia bacterium]